MTTDAATSYPQLFSPIRLGPLELPPTGTPPVYASGDAVAPRGFWATTSDGHRPARTL